VRDLRLRDERSIGLNSTLSYPALVSGAWRELAFEPFHPGIRVHWLLRGGTDAPSAAVLASGPGASVPLHRHAGLETILVLDGVQSDENGDYEAGTLILNPVGSQHSVWSQSGCVVMIQWNLPVIFLGEGA
jgi:anti-sigma factor ChrR (cupin superfamily)